VPPGGVRATAALVVVGFGLLVTAALDIGVVSPVAMSGPGSALAPPSLSMTRRARRIILAGVAGSAADESGLRRHAASRFADAAVETHFEPGVIVPRDWQTIADHLLDVLAATDSASAAIRPRGITVHAVTTGAEAVADKLGALRDVAPPDMRLDADVIVIDTEIQLDALCRREFGRVGKGSVTFALSGAGIGDASAALLDRIIDFANDCRDFTIVVVGHSDDVGEESWNREISLARARSVADYIIAAGIPADRLAVEGRGSSEPVADNGTPSGRRRNRRVEFELHEAHPESSGPASENNSTSKTRVAPGGMTPAAPLSP
jgi:outer membrane protein OmpA-like peptidoglycan-associated protein